MIDSNWFLVTNTNGNTIAAFDTTNDTKKQLIEKKASELGHEIKTLTIPENAENSDIMHEKLSSEAVDWDSRYIDL